MAYGETGRFPIEIDVKLRMIQFWFTLISASENKLSSHMYKLMYSLHETGHTKFKWLDYVKNILDSVGLSYVWIYHKTCLPDITYLKVAIKHKLQDQFIQSWFNQMDISSRGQQYSMFKYRFGLEDYLIRLNENDRKNICKFRTANIKLPVETGRYIGIQRHDRICPLCNSGVGDEFHYLFICDNNNVTLLRQKYIPAYFHINPNQHKMKLMFTNFHRQLLKNISLYIQKLVKIL